MSQGKQLNVNLSFTADSSQAKRQIQDLQQALQNIAKLPGKATSLFDDKQIKEASNAALELQQHLQKAVNVNTGNLDLSRLSTSLKASGQTLDQYYNKLSKIGPEGQAAFLQVAKSISTAEAPVTRVNKRLEEFATTLKNTARWQISSSILHGFMGTLQSAYGYAQRLNESLNNIRIVTGQSVDQMADFAKSANESAKALSTTTTAYTDAALIYYQQGLSDSEVKERTDVTVKMANVARESAEEVSNQMTAVWNNFNKDGDQSAEHFADVMTKLGAETASSTSEIAEGLSKFAGIADTVGLSFDYATSALATITATSRESADVVGTALKTIFGRMEGLKLGETLEDGTSLTKYSEALQTVGVNVKDASGQLKDMDTILDETGKAWQNLTEDQKVATAQTVAGVRQYSQFMTLMDNWDFMQENLARTQEADGTLQEQADIYAESWEAAQKRVQAALESIYGTIIDDKLFIGMTDTFAKLIELIDGTIKSLGGLKGVLASVGSVFLSYYSNKMPDALNNLKQNFMVITGQANKAMIETQQKTAQMLKLSANDPKMSLFYKTQAEGMAKVAEMQQKLSINSRKMTTSEQENYRMRIQNVQKMYEEAAAIAKVVEEYQKEAQYQKDSAIKDVMGKTRSDISNYQQAKSEQSDILKERITSGDNSLRTEEYEKASQVVNEYGQKLDQLASKLGLANKETLMTAQGQSALRNAIKENFGELQKYKETYSQLDALSTEGESKANEWEKEAQSIQKDEKAIQQLKKEMQEYVSLIQNRNSKYDLGIDENKIQSVINSIDQLGQEGADVENVISKFREFVGFSDELSIVNSEMQNTKNLLSELGAGSSLGGFEQISEKAELAKNNLEAVKDNVEATSSDMNENTFSMSKAMTEFGSSVMATYTVVQSFSNGMKTLQDYVNGNVSGLEALGAVASMFMSTMMALNSVTQLAETLSTSKIALLGAEALGYTAVGTAAEAAAVGEAAATAAAAPLLPIIIAIGAAMAALVAIGYGVVKVFQAWKDSTPEGQLENAQQNAEATAEAYDKIAEKVSNVNSELSNYQSARDALSDMTVGTEEWAAAVSDLNNKVLDLIDKYPELASGLNITNGVLAIDEQVMKDFTKELQKQQAMMGVIKANANPYKEESAVGRKDTYSNLRNQGTGKSITSVATAGTGPMNSVSVRQQTFGDLISFDEYESILKAVEKEGTELLKDTTKLRQATNISAEAAEAISKDEKVQGEISTQINEEKAKQLAAEAQMTAAANNYLMTVGNKEYDKLVAGNDQDQMYATMIAAATAKQTKEGSDLYNEAKEAITATGDELAKQYLTVVEGMTEQDSQFSSRLSELKEAQGDNLDAFCTDALASFEATKQFSEQKLNELIETVKNSNMPSNLSPFFTGEDLNIDDLNMGQTAQIANMETATDAERVFGMDKSTIEQIAGEDIDTFIKSCQDKLDHAELNVDNVKDQLKLEGEDLATTFAEIGDKVQELDPMQKIYDKMAKGKGMDWKALTSDTKGGFKDVFSSYTDEYNELMEAITKNPDNLSKQQKAWDNLVTAWIKGSKEFQKVTKETAEAAKKSLRERGVKGADKLIDQMAEENEKAKALRKQYSNLRKETKKYEDTIKKVYKTTNKNIDSAEEFRPAIKAVQKALSEISDKKISFNNARDFLKSSPTAARTLEKALSGDQEAIDDVKQGLTALDMIKAHPEIDMNTEDAVSEVQGLEAYLASADLDAEGWVTLDNSAFLQKWAESEMAAGKSASEIESILNSIPGIEADVNVDYETMEIPSTIPIGGKSKLIVETIQVPKPSVKLRSAPENSAGASIGGGGGGAGYGGSGGGGGGGGKCFAAGTLITTSEGYKNIEDIQIGDTVLSYNEKTKRNEYSTVLQTMVHDTFEKIYTLYIKEDKIKVTGNHKLYITRNWMSHWIAVEDMKIGDLVLFADGTLHLVEDIEFELEYRTVYNFEVSHNHNYYIGKNQILAHNKGGGGGGKGKKGKEEEPDHEEHEEKVHELADRYRDLNEAIDKLNHTMTIHEKRQEHLSGKELINSLTKQNKLIDQQRKNYTRLNKELEKELKLDRKRNKKTGKLEDVSLQGQLRKYGAKFGKDNELENYKKVFQNIEKEYNNAVEKYNSIVDKYNNKSAKQQEKYKKTLEKAKDNLEEAKKTYDKANEYLERYDEVLQEIRQNEEEQKELLYQQIENNLQKFEIKYEMKLETREAKRAVNEFLNTIQKNFKKTFFSRSDWNKEFKFLQDQANTYFNTKNKKGQVTKGTLQIDLDEVKEIQREINKGLYGENSKYNFASQSEAVDKLKEVTERLMEDAEAAQQIWQDFWDTYLESMDQTFERWDDYIGKFDRYQSQLDHNKEVIEMLYGGSDTAKGREQLDQYYNVSIENSLGKQTALSAQIKALKENRSKTTYGEEDYFKYSDQIKAAEDELDAEIESYMQLMQGRLENSVAIARADMDQNIWGKDFSQAQEEWNDKKKQAEGYYDEVQRIYQLEQLESKWKAAITSTTALKTQKQLTDLMERQQKSLSEKTKLSEKDVELAEKELEMYKAQIALEEAQTNKNTMKLTRDAQGNWSYQYVADQDDINQKQSDYLTKVDEWRTASVNAAEEISEKIMNSYQEFSDRLSELMTKTYLSQDEMTTAYNNLYETYWGDDGIITAAVEDSNYIQQEANEATFIELAGLYEANEESFSLMTENEQQLVKDLKDNNIIAGTEIRDFLTGADHKSGITADIIEGAKNINVDSSAAWGELTKNIKENMDGARGSVNDAYKNMKEEGIDKYDQAVAASEEASGIKWSNVEKQIEKVEKNIEKTEDKLDSLIQKTEDLDDFKDKVDDIEQKWKDVKDQIIEATEALEAFLKKKTGEGEKANDTSSKPTSSSSSSGKEKVISSAAKPTTANDFDLSSSSTKEIKEGSKVHYKGGGYAISSDASSVAKNPLYKSGTFYISRIVGGAKYPYHLSKSKDHSKSESWVGWTKKKNIEALKTGGYTGSWNDGSGKLGILHSKELVLNQSDTRNLLDAVGMIRDISSLGSSVSNVISNGLNRLMNNFNIGGFRTGVNGNIDGASKVFNITAEFPNANSVAEIQEAILSLPTLANQYISANN